MPVTDLSGGDDEWLQQYLAGQAAVPGGGPATWAPYGGHPTNYGPPNPLGAGAPQPAQQPQPTPGFSITGALSYLNPISSANAATPGAPRATATPSPLLRPGAANSLPLAGGNPTMQDYQQWLAMQTGGAPPAAPTTAPPANPTPWFPPSNTPLPWRGAPPSRPVTPTPSTAYPASTTPANSAPAGSPSQTPRPANSSSPFAMIDRQNAAATANQPGRGYQTALDLSSLFGRGGGQAAPAAQAANRANVPAANAQPVNGALAQGNNAPWWMGPFQQGVFGPFTPDQTAGRGLKQRYT